MQEEFPQNQRSESVESHRTLTPDSPTHTSVAPSFDPSDSSQGSNFSTENSSSEAMRDSNAETSYSQNASQQSVEFAAPRAPSPLPPATDEQNRSGVQTHQRIDTNYGLAVGVLSVNIWRRIASHRLHPDYVKECLEVFAEPPELSQAQQILRSHRVVVLVGPRGVGRHTTAVHLLSSCGDNLREVQRDPGPISVEDLEHLHTDTRWLLDLRDDEDDAPLTFGRVLAELTNRLHQKNSHLVVTIRQDLWARVGNGGRHLEVQLTPPPAVEVIRKQLANKSPTLPKSDIDRWTTAEAITEGIRNLPPGTAIEWANTIREQHHTTLQQNTTVDSISDLPFDKFEEIVDNVVNARANWRKELAKWHKDNEEHARQQCFLLAAALMENSPAEEIYLASNSLVATFNDEPEKRPGLQGPGILTLSENVGAKVGDDENLIFTKPGYGDSVLEYFWIDRIHLREKFIKWMTDFAVKRGDDLADTVIDRISDYVLRWSSKRRNLTSLETLLRSWILHKKLAGAAVSLATAAALDPSIGKAMRDRMLVWARSDRPEDEALKLLVARASSGPLFEVYPTMMLYRVGHIANAPGPEVGTAVQEAISRMWRVEHLRSNLINEISRWCQSESSPRRMVGRNAFIAIAGLLAPGSQIPLLLHPWLPNKSQIPASVHASPGLQDQQDGPLWLIAGWRAVLDERDASDEVCALLATWMDAAMHSEAAYRLIAEILLGAVHGADGAEFSARRKTFLIDLLYHWSPAFPPSPGPRGTLREKLLYELTLIDPDHSIPGRQVSEISGTSGSSSDIVRDNSTKHTYVGNDVGGDASSRSSEPTETDV